MLVSTHPVIAMLDHLFACGGKRVENVSFSPVGRTASDEIRQNMVACVMAGALANLAEAWG